MNVLVASVGTDSQSAALFHIEKDWPDEPQDPAWRSSLEPATPGLADGQLLWRVSRENKEIWCDTLSSRTPMNERLQCLLDGLFHGKDAPLQNGDRVAWMVHRILHGGEELTEAVRIDRKIDEAIERQAAFAPRANAANLAGIHACRRRFGSSVPQFAVFETAFHHSLPDGAAYYPGSCEWLEKGIRRYGSHGLSFAWCSRRAAALLHRRAGDAPCSLILCHLAETCALCAVRGDQSLDTTTGMTPGDGLPMGTRAGTLDPGVVFHLLREDSDLDYLEGTLGKESGLMGLAGLPGDIGVILKAAQAGHERAQLALHVFLHCLRAGIGRMLGSLGRRPDAIVFTGAMGEHQPEVRAALCGAFEFLGMKLNPEKNTEGMAEGDLAHSGSAIRILVVKSREDWQAVEECRTLWSQAAPAISSAPPPAPPKPKRRK